MTSSQQESAGELTHALKGRHVTMISLGGVIGAGLFVGSSTAISEVGPAVVISYAIAGCIVFFVMQMLGELAANTPGAPTFTEYVRVPLGGCAAFVAGWLYAYFWIIVVAVEALAGAAILREAIPLPQTLLVGLLLLGLTASNLLSVRLYGEFEFWFASIKVTAIIAFIVSGTVYLLNRTFNSATSPDVPLHFSTVSQLSPHGLASIVVAVPAVIFSICGAETGVIAAAESDTPGKHISRVAITVILRVLIFYVGSVALIVMITSPGEVLPGVSPFISTLRCMRVPHAELVMTLVILTAVLSCLNSGLYVASRVVHGLAARGDAPGIFLRLSERRVPASAVIAAAVVAFGITSVSSLSWQALFSFLLNASGAIMLIVYALLAVAQIRNRRAMARRGQQLFAPVWLFPWISLATLAAIASILLTMPLIPSLSSQFAASGAGVLMACGIYRLRYRRT